MSSFSGRTPDGPLSAALTDRLHAALEVTPDDTALLAAVLRGLSVTGGNWPVGGGILVHGIPILAEWLHGVEHSVEGLPAIGHVLAGVTPMLLNGLFGVLAGGLIVAMVAAGTRVVSR
mgnify:CR=1 FL=1